MKDTIPFQGAINFDDAVRADKAIFHKASWSKSGRLAIAILGILTILYMAVQFSFLATLAFVAISAALLWIVMIDAKKTQRRNFEKRRIDGKGILSEDHIELQTSSQQTKLLWSTFKNVQELDGLLILIEDDEHRLAFAPYMFVTHDDWVDCKKLIHEKMETIQPGDTPNTHSPSAQGVGGR